MTTCAVCGREWPDDHAYCGACGHRLGVAPAQLDEWQSQQPHEPTVVNVRVLNSLWDSCLSCFSWVVGIVAIVFVVTWIFSGC